MRRLLSLLGFQTNKRSKSDKPDIRYADPSHNRENWNSGNTGLKHAAYNTPSAFNRRPFAASNPAVTEQNFKDIERVKSATLTCLQEAGSAGLGTFDLNGGIAEQLAPKLLKGLSIKAG